MRLTLRILTYAGIGLLVLAGALTVSWVFVMRSQPSAADLAESLAGRIPIQPGQHYLDIGCGSGRVARRLAEAKNLRVTGIDISAKAIEKARAAGRLANVQFLMMDATALEFPDSSFDAVGASLVLHEIPRREKAFREMVRVRRPGGYLIVHEFRRAKWFPEMKALSDSGGLMSQPDLEALGRDAALEMKYVAEAWPMVDLIWRKPTV